MKTPTEVKITLFWLTDSPGYKHNDSSRLFYPATLQRQAARSSQMRVLIYQTTWRHISEFSTLQA
jgi:flagellar basal body rod protein FlgB